MRPGNRGAPPSALVCQSSRFSGGEGASVTVALGSDGAGFGATILGVRAFGCQGRPVFARARFCCVTQRFSCARLESCFVAMRSH